MSWNMMKEMSSWKAARNEMQIEIGAEMMKLERVLFIKHWNIKPRSFVA